MWIHARRRLRILGLELIEQRSGTLRPLTFLQPATHVRIGAGERNVVDCGTCVQAGTADQDRTNALPLQFGDLLACQLLEASHRHGVIRIDDVDEMMPDLSPFLGARLGGADIHAPIHLVGIGVDDFGPFAFGRQRFGDGDAESRLAGCGRPHDGDHTSRLFLSDGRHRSGLPSDRDRR